MVKPYKTPPARAVKAHAKRQATERPEDEISSPTSHSASDDDLSKPPPSRSTKRRRDILEDPFDDNSSSKKHKMAAVNKSPVIDLCDDLSEDEDSTTGKEDDVNSAEANTPPPKVVVTAKSPRNTDIPPQKRIHSNKEEEMKERFAKLKSSERGPLDLATIRKKDPVLAEWMEKTNAQDDDDDDYKSNENDDLDAPLNQALILESIQNQNKMLESMPEQSIKRGSMSVERNKICKFMPEQPKKRKSKTSRVPESMPEENIKTPDVSRVTHNAIPASVALFLSITPSPFKEQPSLLVPVQFSDLKRKSYLRHLEALNIESGSNGESFPISALDAEMIPPDVIIRDKGYSYHLYHVGYFIAGGFVLMIVMWFMVAVGVGLHMGRLILRGDLDVIPKVYDVIRDHGR